MSWVRRFLAGLVVVAGVTLMLWVQYRFDHADLNRAVDAVHSRFPEAKNCHATMESAWRGLVTVSCDAGTWTVDVVKNAIYH